MMPTSLLARTTFFAWLAAIAALSVVRTDPDGQMPLTITDTGFVNHVAAYFLAMILGYLAYPAARRTRILLLCGFVGLYTSSDAVAVNAASGRFSCGVVFCGRRSNRRTTS